MVSKINPTRPNRNKSQVEIPASNYGAADFSWYPDNQNVIQTYSNYQYGLEFTIATTNVSFNLYRRSLCRWSGQKFTQMYQMQTLSLHEIAGLSNYIFHGPWSSINCVDVPKSLLELVHDRKVGSQQLQAAKTRLMQNIEHKKTIKTLKGTNTWVWSKNNKWSIAN